MHKISDQGIILNIQKHSENSLIIKILSQNYGICSGFVRSSGLLSKKLSFKSSPYQNFNLVDFHWSSKIADNLGFFKIELKKSFLGNIISSKIKLTCLNIIIAVIDQNILEREPVDKVFYGLFDLLQNLDLADDNFLAQYIKFEIELLKALGYGIDLSSCVATGVREDLHFVSPKSARAVCLKAGEKYRDKLLALPQFLLKNYNTKKDKTTTDLLNGLKLSGFFIEKYLATTVKTEVFSSRNMLFQILETPLQNS
jgi:DNA repair protein RecO (recombination protein O)